MIRNQNILAILTIFFSQLKDVIKNFIYKRDKTAIAERFSKISNTKKISNEQFNHCEANNFSRESYKIYKFSNNY